MIVNGAPFRRPRPIPPAPECRLHPLAWWPPELEANLARIPGPPPSWYHDEWHLGRLELCAYGCSALEPLVWLLWRTEDGPSGRELVMVAAVGRPAGRQLTHEVLPFLERLARDEGCRSLRAHTTRPGLMSLLLSAGWACVETVLRRELP